MPRLLPLLRRTPPICISLRRNMSCLLSSGHRMPLLGLGTWQTEEKSARDAVEAAIGAGYRLIDTAFMYQNEPFLGQALQQVLTEGRVRREDLFISSKLPCNGLRAEDVEYFFLKSLKALRLDYLDLYLIHGPVACKRTDDDHETYPYRNGDVLVENVDLLETWKAMECLVDRGLVRSIGLSNFNSRQIQRIYDAAAIKPANLQVECHAYLPQYELHEFCKKLNISMTAYSPLGSPSLPEYAKKMNNVDFNPMKLLTDERLQPIADKHRKSPAQILLRFLTQRGIIPIPKSVQPTRIGENIQIFDFHLTDDDMDILKSMANGFRYFRLDFAPSLKNHPEQPFDIPF